MNLESVVCLACVEEEEEEDHYLVGLDGYLPGRVYYITLEIDDISRALCEARKLSNPKVVVFGGNEIFNRVLKVMELMNIDEPLPLAPVPLNKKSHDFALTFGWDVPEKRHLNTLFEEIVGSKPFTVDRWKVSYCSLETMGNSLSIPAISEPSSFKTKFRQMSSFFCVGESYFTDKSRSKVKEGEIELRIDGKKIELDAWLVTVIVSNLPYTNGISLWRNHKAEGIDPFVDDEKVEVSGIARYGPRKKIRSLGQGREISIITHSYFDALVDNEPFILPPSSIVVSPLLSPPCSSTVSLPERKKLLAKILFNVESVRKMKTYQKLTAVEGLTNLPMLALINPTSGRHLGRKLMRDLEALIGKDRVFNVLQTDFNKILKNSSIDSGRLRIVIGGGDGTIGRVLHKMDEIGFTTDCFPPIGVIPLGTGNDFSRAMGWGKSYTGSPIAPFLLDTCERAEVVNLDRWSVNCSSLAENGNKNFVMTNFISVGLDAATSLIYNYIREHHKQRFNKRRGVFGRAAYIWYGLRVVTRDPNIYHPLKVSLEVDGREIKLPKRIVSLVVVNLPCFGNIDLWGLKKTSHLKRREGSSSEEKEWEPSKIDDGLVEVVAVKSAAHLALIEMKVTTGVCIAQGREVR